MRILAVFARANHPAGYGAVNGTAHGYVIVVVLCDDSVEYMMVLNALARPLQWPGRRGDGWYDGPYEMVWSGQVTHLQNGAVANDGPIPIPPIWRSIGDNRAVAYVRGQDLLNAGNDLRAPE